MAATAPIALTGATFDETLARPGVVLIDVWAPWCSPCRAFAPIFQAACEAHPDLLFASIDADAEPELAKRLKIMGIPTLLVYRDGQRVRRTLGSLSAARLERLIAKVTAANDGATQAGASRGRGLGSWLRRR